MTVEKVQTLLGESPVRIADAVRDVPPRHLHASRAPGEWSANEVLAHLRACADVWGSCIDRILAEDEPTFRAVNPRTWIANTDYMGQEFKDSLEAFTDQRAALLFRLETLTPIEWSRRATGAPPRAGVPINTSNGIERWTSAHPRWSELMSLTDVQDLRLEEKVQEWHLGIYTVVAIEETEIAGVLRFWTQVIGLDEDKPSFLVEGEPAVEAKVVTFHVFERFRKRGIGRRLQLEGVKWARDLGCYQIRTRSAYAREDNHRLKASLGFGISPGRNRADGPEDTAFFVLPLRLVPELMLADS